MTKETEVLEKIKRKNGKSVSGIKRFLTRRNIILALILLFIFFIVRNSALKGSTVKTDLTKVQKETIEEVISASGKIDAEKKSVLTFNSAAKVDKVNVVEGQEVNKGQFLASLDTTNLYQAYLQAEANLRTAAATKSRVYDQLQGHETNESYSQKETRTTAESAYDVAYRNYVVAQENLSNARMIAPFSGIVTDITDAMMPGVNILATTGSITIVDPTTVYFSADVNEVDVSKIKNDQPVKLEIDAYPDQQFTQKVYTIGFTSKLTSTGGTAYPIKVTLPNNSDMQFRLGMKGNAEFVLEKKEGILTVPLTALIEDSDKRYVWIVENNKAKKIEVKTGISSLDKQEIVSGISEGTTIITRPDKNIREGITIVAK
jgi:RND family efflux transporter MFP subunit